MKPEWERLKQAKADAKLKPPPVPPGQRAPYKEDPLAQFIDP